MKYDKSPMEKESGVREPLAGCSGQAKMKRLTVDVSANLHAAIKMECARKGVKMADAIRELLEGEFGRGE